MYVISKIHIDPPDIVHLSYRWGKQGQQLAPHCGGTFLMPLTEMGGPLHYH